MNHFVDTLFKLACVFGSDDQGMLRINLVKKIYLELNMERNLS